MAEKTLKTRVLLKHETSENWAKATGFAPKEGEVCIYDNAKIKLGDGETNINDLDFLCEAITATEISSICV